MTGAAYGTSPTLLASDALHSAVRDYVSRHPDCVLDMDSIQVRSKNECAARVLAGEAVQEALRIYNQLPGDAFHTPRRKRSLASVTVESAIQRAARELRFEVAAPDPTRGLDLITAALKHEPRLTFAGLGESTSALRPEAVARCAQWIQWIGGSPTLLRVRGSYGLKHDVESWLRDRTTFTGDAYTSNGEFLAAAIGLGLRYEPTAGPNADVGLDAQRWRRARLLHARLADLTARVSPANIAASR